MFAPVTEERHSTATSHDEVMHDTSIANDITKEFAHESTSNESGDEMIDISEDHIAILSHPSQGSGEFSTFLKDWAIRNNITHSALNELLKECQKFSPDLPGDARTFLGTKRDSVSSLSLGSGKLVYLGFAEGILNILNQDQCKKNCINIDLHVDGMQICRSSSSSMWPILCSVTDSNQLI